MVVVAIISCSKAAEERSAFDECLETYLDLKVNSQNESIIENTTSGCNYVASIFETVIKEEVVVELSDTNKCVSREMEETPFLNYVVGFQVMILQSESIESRKLSLPSELFTYLMKYAWIAASLKCVKNEEINDIFDTAGLENVTISTPEEKYCFAKYASDKELFQSKNVELNPSGLSIEDIDCGTIIEEKRVQFSLDVPLFAFRMRSFWNVLDYIELPKETKDAAKTSFKNKYAARLLISISKLD